MANENNQRERARYGIKMTTYTKRPTGKKNKYGHNEYETVGEPTQRFRKNTNFTELKKELYDNSKNKDNVYVAYTKPVYRINKCRPRVKSVTIRMADGTKKVTYYNAVQNDSTK